ncbi:hypothetical protein BASA81_004040 [Batrachochytrium salamandrivorans]|nr:hypothetical protein BASA81_004040 [Batrachochytrium salamandrivorans]
MASQDFIEFSDGEQDDGDDVHAILAALQARKEKQQKMKKSIRDRANKSQKQIKDESELANAKVDALVQKLAQSHEELLQIQAKGQTSHLPALPPAPTREEDEELALARQQVQALGKQLVQEEQDSAQRFKKVLARFSQKLDSSQKRAKNQDILQSLADLQEQVDRSIREIRQE